MGGGVWWRLVASGALASRCVDGSWESVWVQSGIEDTHSHLHNNKSVVTLIPLSVSSIHRRLCNFIFFFFFLLKQTRSSTDIGRPPSCIT